MKFKIVKFRFGNLLKILAAAFVIGLGGLWVTLMRARKFPGMLI